MPGGRGTILDIAYSLNDSKHAKIAKAVKTAIDKGYRISNTSVTMVGAAYSKCKHPADLTDIWSHASSKGAVDWLDY